MKVKLRQIGKVELTSKTYALTSFDLDSAEPKYFMIPCRERSYWVESTLETRVGSGQYILSNKEVSNIGSNMGSCHGGNI